MTLWVNNDTLQRPRDVRFSPDSDQTAACRTNRPLGPITDILPASRRTMKYGTDLVFEA